MEITEGLIFTGKNFTGRVEVIEIDEAENRLRVGLVKKNPSSFSNWNEDWDLKHTICGFEEGEYFIKDFPNYPPDLS